MLRIRVIWPVSLAAHVNWKRMLMLECPHCGTKVISKDGGTVPIRGLWCDSCGNVVEDAKELVDREISRVEYHTSSEDDAYATYC